MPTPITDRIHTLQHRIEAALAASGRTDSVAVLAASKTRSMEAIDQAACAGLRVFGENYAADFSRKSTERPDLEWHFIGHLQRNKAKLVVPHVHTLHTLDRVSLADTLETLLERTMRVLIQVNVSEEPTKSGCSVAEAGALADHVVAHCPHLELAGLMTMPPPTEDPRPVFDALRILRDSLAGAVGQPLPVLSMGMSDDLEAAIERGSTLVRVGAAIFGPRAPLP